MILTFLAVQAPLPPRSPRPLPGQGPGKGLSAFPMPSPPSLQARSTSGRAGIPLPPAPRTTGGVEEETYEAPTEEDDLLYEDTPDVIPDVGGARSRQRKNYDDVVYTAPTVRCRRERRLHANANSNP